MNVAFKEYCLILYLEKQKTGFLGSRNVFKMFLFEEVKNICGIETHKTIPDFNEVYEVFSFMTDMNMRDYKRSLLWI